MTDPPGWALWLTGLPASGKTSIALELQRLLADRGVKPVVLDSDAVRGVLTPAPQYTEAERADFYARLALLAELLVSQGINVIVAATANRRAHREFARSRLPRFIEVWVRCPVEVCRARDPKELYARAAAGEIHDFPGVDALYEPPPSAEWVVDTQERAPDAAAQEILAAFSFLSDS